MTDRSSQMTGTVARDGAGTAAAAPGTAAKREARKASRVARRVRRLAWLAVAAQVAFVAGWLLAAAWQGPLYSVVADSISDMYAVTAPGGAFLVVVFTLCGAATMWFAWRSLRPALGPAGWPATIGSVLVALSICGLGDLLTATERLACRLADPGCTPAAQLSNAGGKMDKARGVIRRSRAASY